MSNDSSRATLASTTHANWARLIWCSAFILLSPLTGWAGTDRWYGGDLGAGYEGLRDKHGAEANKSGFLINAKLTGELRAPKRYTLSTSLGFQFTDQVGESASWRESVQTIHPILNLTYLRALPARRIHVGARYHLQTGDAALFDLDNKRDWQTVHYVGPQVEVRLRPRPDGRQWVFGIGALVSIAAPERLIYQIPITIGYRVPLNPPTSAVPIPLESVGIDLGTKYVNFDLDRSNLRPESSELLAKIAATINSMPTVWRTLIINGHTDVSGAPERNLRLSVERARSVARALVADGVDAHRITSFGYGQDRPLVDTAGEDEKNRRVELVFTGVTDRRRLERELGKVINRSSPDEATVPTPEPSLPEPPPPAAAPPSTEINAPGSDAAGSNAAGEAHP